MVCAMLATLAVPVLTPAQQYYRVAARLGDPDAQQELAFCLEHGKGCKKDKREAAKWYRAAVRLHCSPLLILAHAYTEVIYLTR